MNPWPAPSRPALPHTTSQPRLRLRDTGSGQQQLIGSPAHAAIYVCGITPYDATHIGHAATYVTFDLAIRSLLDSGVDVDYVQNVTDVDDPLLERATERGLDWRELAKSETALFFEDMTALGVIPPKSYVGAVESIPDVVQVVEQLVATSAAYPVSSDGAGDDIYLDLARTPGWAEVTKAPRDELLEIFAERGGDPDRKGKRDRLDPLLWRAARAGEPDWDGGSLGRGRPGWHVECTCIARKHLGATVDLQGGGSDLVFPHHAMCAATAGALGERFARTYAHQAMVGLDGHKMSKSRGNLVLVSRLRADGLDPMAIRTVLVGQHYATDWEWTDDLLVAGIRRLARWRQALSTPQCASATGVLASLRERLADDLDGAGALAVVDDWTDRTLARTGPAGDGASAGEVARAMDALLGIRL